MAGKPGAWSGTMDANKKTQTICDEVKRDVEEKTGKDCKEFEAVEYRNKTVSGDNLLIKVHVGDENYFHLNVFKDSRAEVKDEVRGVQVNKDKEDAIIPFTN